MGRKINDSYVLAKTDLSNLTGGETLKVEWDTVNNGNLHWMDVDESSLEYVAPFHFHNASVSGYSSGGRPSGYSDVIQKYSFVSDADATDVANLTVARELMGGSSSTTHGYAAGGKVSSYYNIIDKFSFSVGSNATNVGDLTVSRYRTAGQSSTDNGYTSGGWDGSASNIIEKYSFSADGNSTDVGDLSGNAVGRSQSAGQSSSTYGYNSSGYDGTDYLNIIDKFSFSSDGNATDVGDMTTASLAGAAGNSSSTHGYSSGGGGYDNRINKFTFASDASATHVGYLNYSAYLIAGSSSSTHGYSAGGYGPVGGSAGNVNFIDKFSFASDGNATDVGDLFETTRYATGQQY